MLQLGTRGNPNAQILIVGEAWSADDAHKLQPFTGMVGKELYDILTAAGIDPNNCYYTNVINKRPANNDMKNFFIPSKEAKQLKLQDTRGLFPDTVILEGLQKLQELIETLKPKLIIGLGNYALWALTEDSFKIISSAGYKIPTGITNYRGSQLRSRFWDIPLLPIYHPATILKQYVWRSQTIHDLHARVKKAFTNDWDDIPRQFYIQPTFETVHEVLSKVILQAELSDTPVIATCDIETTSFQLECVGIGLSKTEALCIPFICHADKKGYWSLEEEIAIVELLRRFLTHPNIAIVGQNYLYDWQYLWLFLGINSNYNHDTMLAHHVNFPGTPMGLDHLSSLYCSFHTYWKEDGKEANKNHDDLQRWIYNCRDCVVTYEVITELWNVIKHYNLQKQYAIQMVRANSVIKMMTKGVKVDEKVRGQQRKKLLEATMILEDRLENLLPVTIYPRQKGKAKWFASPQQLAHLFYEILAQPKVLNYTANGPTPTTDDDALTKIATREPLLKPICDAIKQYRSMKVFADFINMKVSVDGRMRTSFSPTTETFRYRSSGDAFGRGRNLQNLPKGNEE